MKFLKPLFAGLTMLVGCGAFEAQQTGWAARLVLPKSEYLPGEPISLTIHLENLGPGAHPNPGFKGAFYLDGCTRPCSSGIKDYPLFPSPVPGEGAIQREYTPPSEPQGVRHNSPPIEITLACAEDFAKARSPLTGPHSLLYRQPAFGKLRGYEARADFMILSPSGDDARAYEYYKGDPLKGKDLVERFPNSNYAALALWQEGLEEYTGFREIGAEKEFAYPEAQKKAFEGSPGALASSRKLIMSVVTPWERLYSDFPSFGYRPELMLGLTRCYFRLGDYAKAVPLLQELLTKFPDSEWAKRGAAYKELLQAHGKWPE